MAGGEDHGAKPRAKFAACHAHCEGRRHEAVSRSSKRLLDLWVENTQSPGAKADAQALRDAVKPMFDKRFQDTSHMFEEFVRSEQGRFIGTVKTETDNAGAVSESATGAPQQDR